MNIQENFTDDSILNGKILLRQPKKGYRVAIDPIILASFIEPKDNQEILDVGCGVGAISLILKRKNRSAKITAIDIDENMCELCRYNSEKNSLELSVKNIGIGNMPKENLYDFVITNPPFFSKESSRVSATKELANFETMELADWISLCLNLLKNKGIFSIIHDTSRIGDILAAIKGRAGSAEIIPIFPKENKEAVRVVVKCVKGSFSKTKMHRGIVMHSEDGKYSEVAKKILDEAKLY